MVCYEVFMLKISVIGGGSTYTPELVNGFLQRIADLPVDELWLMDVDPQRLAVVGGLHSAWFRLPAIPFRYI